MRESWRYGIGPSILMNSIEIISATNNPTIIIKMYLEEVEGFINLHIHRKLFR